MALYQMISHVFTVSINSKNCYIPLLLCYLELFILILWLNYVISPLYSCYVSFKFMVSFFFTLYICVYIHVCIYVNSCVHVSIYTCNFLSINRSFPYKIYANIFCKWIFLSYNTSQPQVSLPPFVQAHTMSLSMRLAFDFHLEECVSKRK